MHRLPAGVFYPHGIPAASLSYKCWTRPVNGYSWPKNVPIQTFTKGARDTVHRRLAYHAGLFRLCFGDRVRPQALHAYQQRLLSLPDAPFPPGSADLPSSPPTLERRKSSAWAPLAPVWHHHQPLPTGSGLSLRWSSSAFSMMPF